jgi:hypothetical protein
VDDLCAWLGCASSELERELDEASEQEEVEELRRESAPASSPFKSFPPGSSERRALARRSQRRRSPAWGHTDRYYGTRAVGVLE